MRRRIEFALAASTWLVAAACGGGDGGPPSPPPPPTVASVVVALASASIPVGQTTTATATARDAQGATISGKTPSWSSANSSVASVSGDGTVTGVAAGSTEITATIDGRTGSATVTVTPPPVSTVTVTLSAPTISVGQSTQATAVLRDGSGAVVTGRTIAWSSSNTGVATVTNAGLVVAIAAGSATITASSEGRTGQATVTVIVVPTVGNVVLLGANGQPLDTSRVAGRVTIELDMTLPPGWRGVREVRIGSRVFRRDSVAGSSVLDAARLLREAAVMDVSSPVATLSSGELQYLTLGNGPQTAVIDLIGSIPPANPTTTSSQVQFRTQQNNFLHLFIDPQQERTIAGTSTSTGDIKGRLGIGIFDQDAIQSVEILMGPASAQYSGTTSLVSIATLTGSSLRREFNIPRSALPGESPLSGSAFLARVQWRDYGLWDPRLQTYATANWAASINGSGFAHPVNNTTGVNVPANIGLQYTPTPDVSQLLPGFVPYTTSITYDHSLNAPVDVFSILQANNTIGSSLYATGTEVGSFSNRLRSTYDLRLGLQYSRFSDRSGIDATKTTIRYGSLLSPKSAWTTWSPTVPLPGTSGSYTLGAEACFEDFAGNTGCADLVTNALNNITSTGSPGGINMRAAFAVGGPTGTMTFGGVTSPFINNWPTVGTASRTAIASGFTPGYLPSLFGAWNVEMSYGTTTRKLFGTGPAGADPVLYPSVTSGNGGNANFAFNTWTAQALSVVGSDEGVYRGTFAYRQADGSLFGSPQSVYLVNDRTSPSKPTGTYQGGQARDNWDAVISGTDNVGFGGMAWGWRSTKVDTRFLNDRFYYYEGQQTIGGGPTAPLEASGSWAIGGVIPGSITFADAGGGFSGATASAFDALVDKFWDLGGNPSFEEFFTFLALFPDRQTTPPDRFEQFQSGASACVGTSTFCGSVPRTRFLDGGITTLTSTRFVDKLDVFGVHDLTKRVHYFGSSTSTQTSPFSGKFRTFYFVPFDAGRFGGPAGNYNLFSVARSSMDDVFVSNFLPFAVLKGQP